MQTAVHISHEASQKIGGIGTVLHGLITAKDYKKFFKNTLLYTPLFHKEGKVNRRLGEQSEVLYSSLDNFDENGWSKIFKPIEENYGVKIAYGKRKFYDQVLNDEHTYVDIVAIDIWNMKPSHINDFKYKLWTYYGIQSDHFAHDRDYEQYLRIAITLRDIVEALYGKEKPAVIFSHEYMGLASAFAFEIDKKEQRRNGDVTILYAHEVSTARVVAEGNPGQDLSFYNIMNYDRDEGVSLEEEFGSYAHYSRNELVKRAVNLDMIFAVSDITKEEYMYLCPKADSNKIKIVYNGIHVNKIPFSEKQESIERMHDYCENLFNFRPDQVFTHVTRFVVSKAIWRDIAFLYYLDKHFAANGMKGFYVLLSTLIGEGRSHESVMKMEKEYGWPTLHKEGLPDLIGHESNIYKRLEVFNAKSKAIKGVFINQFGFSREKCGQKVPMNSSLHDLRFASDIEFGMSIYEPFGIAQLETLPYGGMPLVTDVCGCSCLLKNALDSSNYLSIDFTKVPSELSEQLKTKADFKNISKELRNLVERTICKENAELIIDALPKSQKERIDRFETMQEKSKLLDWNHVAKRINDYIKPFSI